MTEKATILADFLGSVCSGCGGRKKPKMSHCRQCYYSLPQPLRFALYRRFGSGYEEAFEESKKFLAARKPEDRITRSDIDDFTRTVRGPK
ncbi:MAG: hypothetical protein ACRD59_14260 [Candidatus Acidiferrales bacterium]